MTRTLTSVCVFVGISIPALVFAASAADASAGTLVLQAATIAINTYVASGIGSLRRRVEALERRQ
jgi:hypothetical protein